MVLNLACTADHTECLSKVQEKFNQWISDPTQILSQDLRSIVYKYGKRFSQVKLEIVNLYFGILKICYSKLKQNKYL